MKTQEIVEELSRLVQLDIDAVQAYDAALSALGQGPIATELSLFKVDHQRHVLELSQLIMGLGYNPPEVKPDAKGALLKGLTGLRARLGPEQALLAMRSNEQLTTSMYAKALAKPFPEQVLDVVRRGHGDEGRHLAYIERALDSRLWEAGAAHP
jgi:hypothetical protein